MWRSLRNVGIYQMEFFEKSLVPSTSQIKNNEIKSREGWQSSHLKKKKVNEKANICWFLDSLHNMEATSAVLETRKIFYGLGFFLFSPRSWASWEQIPKLHCSSSLCGTIFDQSSLPQRIVPICTFYKYTHWIYDFPT